MLKINHIAILTISIILMGCNSSNQQTSQPTQTSDAKKIPWPEASSNQKRFMIELPKKADESDKEVELIIGKRMKTDSCNKFFFGGNIEKKTLEGWGYNYYVANPTQMAGTRRACIDNKEVEKFVQMGSSREMKLRYNSKLPIVVYAPKDFEVSYKLWTKDGKVYPAESK